MYCLRIWLIFSSMLVVSSLLISLIRLSSHRTSSLVVGAGACFFTGARERSLVVD
jgi:hypothetical protein